jgi:CRP-like cAMP-binding protein
MARPLGAAARDRCDRHHSHKAMLRLVFRPAARWIGGRSGFDLGDARSAAELRWLRRTRLVRFRLWVEEPVTTSIGLNGHAGAPHATRDIAATMALNPVFAVLPEARRHQLAASGTPMRLEAGASLFSVGDEAEAVYVVLAGEVEVAVPAPDGRDVWLAKIGAGSLVGEMGVLDGGSRSAGVRAGPRTDLWRISRRAVMDILREEPSSGLALLAMMAQRLRMADALLQERVLLDLGGRLAGLLLESQGAVVALSQGEMARLIGASRERVNRKLAAWRSEGWIDIGAYGVKLLNRQALASAARPTPAV